MPPRGHGKLDAANGLVCPAMPVRPRPSSPAEAWASPVAARNATKPAGLVALSTKASPSACARDALAALLLVLTPGTQATTAPWMEPVQLVRSRTSDTSSPQVVTTMPAAAAPRLQVTG